MQSHRRNFERFLFERDQPSQQVPPTKAAPRSPVVTNGHANAA